MIVARSMSKAFVLHDVSLDESIQYISHYDIVAKASERAGFPARIAYKLVGIGSDMVGLEDVTLKPHCTDQYASFLLDEAMQGSALILVSHNVPSMDTSMLTEFAIQ